MSVANSHISMGGGRMHLERTAGGKDAQMSARAVKTI